MLKAVLLQCIDRHFMSTAASATASAPPDIQRKEIRVPKSGQFHLLDKALTNKEIDAVLDSIAKDLGDLPSVPARYRDIRNASSSTKLHGYQVTTREAVLIQPFFRTPLLFPNTAHDEGRYAYLLLLQIEVHDGDPATTERYLFSQREYAADPLEHGLEKRCSEIAPPAFLEQFIAPQNPGTNEQTRIERLSMRMMASSKGEIRRKILEAHDVASATSSLGLHRAIAGSMTLAVPTPTKNRLVAVSPHRQRIRAGSTRVPLDSVVEWACECVIGFYKARKTSKVSSTFIAQMAQPLDQMANKVPSSLLIEKHALLKELERHKYETGQVWLAGSSTPKGWTVEDVLDAFSEPLELNDSPLDKKGNPQPLSPAPTEVYYQSIRKSFGFSTKDRAVQLRVTSRTCSVILPAGAGWIGASATAANKISLADFITRKKTFRAVFDHGRALYCSEGAYRSSDLQLATSQLLKIFQVVPDLAKVHTEKGVFSSKPSSFDPTSSFHFIESDPLITSTTSMLICDDATAEWCDFIEIDANKNRIRWLHAKVQQIELKSDREQRQAAQKAGTTLPKKTQAVGTSPSISASDLEEVVGQAIKNLSRLRMLSSDPEFKKRKTDWETKDCALVTTGPVARMRRLGKLAVADIGARFDAAAAHPYTEYEVGIVVPNYSLKRLQDEFAKIEKRKASQPVVQAFWLLSGFMHACLEVGARPMVFVHQ